VKQLRLINYLSCPTLPRRSMDFQGVFLTLSHQLFLRLLGTESNRERLGTQLPPRLHVALSELGFERRACHLAFPLKHTIPTLPLALYLSAEPETLPSGHKRIFS
jgi:hypothetical protein